MTRVRIAGGWVLLLSLLIAALPAEAQRSIEVYRPKHRLADELLPIARTALGDAGVVSVDAGTNALVIAGEPAAVDQTLDLLRQQDQKLKTIILTTAWRTQAELEAAGVQVAWQVEGGSVRIGNARLPGGGTRVFGRVFSTEGTRDRSFESQVRVLDGQSAHIGAGRTVPVVTEGLYDRRATAFVSGEQGFTASPRVLGDGRIRVRIDPVDARVDDRGRVNSAGASTVVEAEPGETVILGGIDRRSDSARTGISAGAEETATSERLLLLTVEVD